MGKSPLLVPEKFRLKQIFRNSSAIHRDKRLILTIAIVMKRPYKQLLPCAGFPGYQHGTVSRSDLRKYCEDLRKSKAVFDYSTKIKSHPASRIILNGENFNKPFHMIRALTSYNI
ncbi:protein of unknown function [Maridesulfovibrio hydrothermalis AM13 = DSM 14728]|uniref:Uncharacterized protein n=1 Tax=Maridesulfovibrio hydrothermalis AM13 = DSM 14728 TaxID=1121451 RepID=L0RAR9_9BACT|nr:protein of unknown function [Maridesulfovibrio hydrothermalis AM13 = DSM 14728]